MEKKELFKYEDRFLDNITEQTGELYSNTHLDSGHDLTPNLLDDKPRFLPYFMEKKETSVGTSCLDAIYTWDNDVYIYLSKNDPMISSFSCKVYYPIRKKKDVEFFILNLKKLKKA